MALLLLGTTGTAAFASAPASSTNSASAIHAGTVTHGFTAIGSPSVTPDHTVKSVWAGYGQAEKGTAANLYAGADGWIVPKTTCKATSPNLQASFLIAWLDSGGADSTYGGLLFECAVGQTGPATIVVIDSVGSYTGVSAGDQVTVFVADESGTGATANCAGSCTYISIVDWTTSAAIVDSVAQTTFSHNSFVGVLDVATSGSCTGVGNVCPQVHFAPIKDGGLYATIPVVCAFNADGTSPAYPCAGYGPDTLPTYYYPIGVAPAGAVVDKFIMNTGDLGVILAPYYTHTGALSATDHASHILKFVKA